SRFKLQFACLERHQLNVFGPVQTPRERQKPSLSNDETGAFRNNLIMSIYVGLIACEDRPGLVHEITGVLFRSHVNVTENQEYVDHGKKRFFMRTQFEGSVDAKRLNAQLTGILPGNAYC